MDIRLSGLRYLAEACGLDSGTVLESIASRVEQASNELMRGNMTGMGTDGTGATSGLNSCVNRVTVMSHITLGTASKRF